MSSRANAYAKSNDPSASKEERMTKLKLELREHIRFLSDYDILSTDWLRMAESLHQIANVAFMEIRLPPSDSNPLMQAGKKDKGTLWDQERDELAIRILLEEGKLNLVLRILHKYKEFLRSDDFEGTVKATSKKFNSDVLTVTNSCRVFEQSLGVLLKFALQHIEALQIMDVPEFMQHSAECLQDALELKEPDRGADSEKMQNTLVIHYLASLSANMEEMDEDRVMDLVEENNVLPKMIQHLNEHYMWYRVETLEAAARFLSNIMNSEAYGTEPTRYIDGDDIQGVVNLKGYFVSELINTYGLKKSAVQKLLDQLNRFEDKVGKCTTTSQLLK